MRSAGERPVTDFFAAQLTVDIGADAIKVHREHGSDPIGSAMTLADVGKTREARLADLAKAKTGLPMTLLKYCVLGTCYSILSSFSIVASMGIGLVAM